MANKEDLEIMSDDERRNEETAAEQLAAISEPPNPLSTVAMSVLALLRHRLLTVKEIQDETQLKEDALTKAIAELENEKRRCIVSTADGVMITPTGAAQIPQKK